MTSGAQIGVADLDEARAAGAIRRVDQGDLDDHQVEEVGSTLMALERRMNEICDYFGLTLDDLNLDLGPLGPLLARD